MKKIFNYFNFRFFTYVIKKIELLSLKKIQQKDIIWLFATPKSGSTFVSYYLHKVMSNRALITPFEKIPSMYQEINSFLFLFKILASPKKKFITINIHSKCNENYFRFFSKKHIVLVQYRNIYYSIESYIDHIDSLIANSQYDHFLFNIDVKIWNSFSFDERVDFLIFFYLPWHVNFIISWHGSQLPCRKLYINYTDLFPDAKSFFEKNNILINKNKIEPLFDNSKILFKKGLDRKLKMTEKQVIKIREKVYMHCKNHNLDVEKLFFS